MKYLLGNKEEGIIDLREMLYYWTICIMIGYTLRGIIALINNESVISLI
jgi:hypothetical protein